MTSASVGFQCPECVAAGAASTPELRSTFGAVVPSRPIVTWTLIGACVAVFGYEYLVGIDSVAEDWSMWPVGIAAYDEYYRLFTSMFLHYSLLHIGFNMLVLVMLGPQLEFALGHARFAALYLVAGLGGSVASFWFSEPMVLAGGASGAIFGLMGAYVVVGKALRADVTQVIGLIAINVVIGFVVPSTDWRAHLGGLVTGVVVALVLTRIPGRSKAAVQAAAVVGVLVVLAVLVLVRDNQLSAEIAALLGSAA